jgi:hypothetical protein
MTRTSSRLAVAVTLAAVALRAPAHEVDCAKLAALAVLRADGSGLPVLDPGGLPSLATSPGPILTVDRYPAIVAFDVQIRNLASEPSVISGVADTLPSDGARVTAFGEAPRRIPVGAVAHLVYSVQVRSLDDCLATFPVDGLPDAPACGPSRENTFLVTTESDIAACRAQIRCAPPVAPPPPPPPSTCAAPTWAGILEVLPSDAVTIGHGEAVGCDGSTWVSASSFPGLGTHPPGALVRFDPAGVATATLLGADRFLALTPDRAGGLVAVVEGGAGGDLGAAHGAALSIRSLDASIAERWDLPLADSAPNVGAGLVLDPAGNPVISYLRLDAQQNAHEIVRKLSPDGALLWEAELATSLTGRVTAADDASIYFLARPRTPLPVGPQPAYVVRLDPDGHLVSTRVIDVPPHAALVAITVGPGGRVVATGTTDAPIDGGPPLAATQAFVASWEAAGTLEWVHVFRPTPVPGGFGAAAAATFASIVLPDSTGALWVGGFVTLGLLDPSAPVGVAPAQPFVARLDAAGSPLWTRQFLYGDQSGSSLGGLVLDGADHAVAMFNIHESLDNWRTWLVRIAPDGT